jgi:hypothetical protein
MLKEVFTSNSLQFRATLSVKNHVRTPKFAMSLRYFDLWSGLKHAGAGAGVPVKGLLG